jgi:hypothetical protein
MPEGLEDSVVQSLNDEVLLNVGHQESNKLKIREVDNCTLTHMLVQKVTFNPNLSPLPILDPFCLL